MPTGLWSEVGNYTDNWMGLTGNWAIDQTLYNGTAIFAITNGADFAAFLRINQANNLYTFTNKTVQITAGIDLSAHYWDVAGGRTNGPTNSFHGTLDGLGNTVSGLEINYFAFNPASIGFGTDFGSFGLMPSFYNATCRDLTLDSPIVVLYNYAPSFSLGVGTLVGFISGTTLTNITVNNARFSQVPNNGQGASGGLFFGGIAGASYNQFTRNVPQNLPNTYQDCTVNGVTFAYTQPIDQGYKFFLGFGGIVGGDVPFGANKTNPFQSRMTQCTVRDMSVTRGPNLVTAFAYEGYGALMGFWSFPMLVDECFASNLLVDVTHAATQNGITFGEVGPATIMVGGLFGYAGIDPLFLQGAYGVTNSYAEGRLVGTANPDLFPSTFGGLIGFNDDPSIPISFCYTHVDLTNLRDHFNAKMRYGNLCGALLSPSLLTQNIFNNWDYCTEVIESDGYAGRKLSTFAVASWFENPLGTDLSRNWTITKNVMTVMVKGFPLNYLQCAEAVVVADFNNNFRVVSYQNPNLTQDADTAQVMWIVDSAGDLFPMLSTVESLINGVVWTFTKRIRVLLASYTIVATAGPGGTIDPLGATAVPALGAQWYAITPEKGYRVLDVRVDGVSIGMTLEYNFFDVMRDHEIHVTFQKDGPAGGIDGPMLPNRLLCLPCPVCKINRADQWLQECPRVEPPPRPCPKHPR